MTVLVRLHQACHRRLQVSYCLNGLSFNNLYIYKGNLYESHIEKRIECEELEALPWPILSTVRYSTVQWPLPKPGKIEHGH